MVELGWYFEARSGSVVVGEFFLVPARKYPRVINNNSPSVGHLSNNPLTNPCSFPSTPGVWLKVGPVQVMEVSNCGIFFEDFG